MSGTFAIFVMILVLGLLNNWDEVTDFRMDAKFNKSIENLIILELHDRYDDLDEFEYKKIRTITQRIRKKDDLRYLLRSCYEQICSEYTKDANNISAVYEEIMGKVADLVIEESVKIIFTDKVEEAMSYVSEDDE